MRKGWRWILVVVATVAAGCASDGGIDGFTGSTVGQPTITSATLTGSIIEITLMPWPEGPQKTATREGSFSFSERQFQQMVDTLGWPLPEPLAQPKRCDRYAKNYTIVVTLDSGQSQWFGPCARPPQAELAALFRW